MLFRSPFESTVDAEPPLASEPTAKQRNPAAERQQVMLWGGGALVVIVLCGALLLMIRRSSRPAAPVDTASAAIPAAASAMSTSGAPGERTAAAPGRAVDVEGRLRDGKEEQARLEAEILNHIRLPAATKATEILIRHVRESALKDPATAANVLRVWISETKGRTA